LNSVTCIFTTAPQSNEEFYKEYIHYNLFEESIKLLFNNNKALRDNNKIFIKSVKYVYVGVNW
jgi:hypothetical protein